MSGRVWLHVHDAHFDPGEARDPTGKWTGGGSSDWVTAAHDPPGHYSVSKIDPGYQPKKTKLAYKQFRIKKDGKLYPLFINNTEPTPEGEWIAAKVGKVPTDKHGKPLFAKRPGWHSGELPVGRQLWSKDPFPQRQDDRVWAEVEVPDDVNWQGEADKTGGELINRIPEGGNYRFLEASQKGGRGTPWYISGALKIRKRLTDEDVRDILHHAGKDEMIGPETRYKHGLKGGETFASPNVYELPSMSSAHAMATAQAQLKSRRHKLFQAAAEDIDLTLGIRSKSEKSGVGAWRDGAESTTVMIAPGATPEQLRLSAAMKGWLGQQKSVLSFTANPNGAGRMYSAHAKGALDDIHRQLLSKGLENHTLVPTSNGATIYIADEDGSLAQTVSSYTRSYPAKFSVTAGDTEFIGATHYEGTTDAEQRAEGRKAYEAVIAAGAGVGARDWGRLRDRWASALEQTQDAAVVRRTYRQAELSDQHAPRTGELIYVFRAGSDQERALANRDAGSAMGVAQHLAMLDDFTSVKPASLLGGGPTCVHLYAVRLHDRVGPYQAIVGGTTPGLGVKGIGYRSKGGAAAISFGEHGYSAVHVLSFPLREVRNELLAHGPTADFFKAGCPAVADAIHAVAMRHRRVSIFPPSNEAVRDRRRLFHLHVGDQEVFVEAEHPRQIGQHYPGRFAPKGTGGHPSGVHITTPHAGPATQVHVHQPSTAAPPPTGKPALRGSQGHPATISSARITAKRGAANSNETYTQTGLRAMQADPVNFAKAMELLKNPQMYPYFRGLHGTPDEIAEQVIAQEVENLKYFAAHAPPQTRKWGAAWYGEENKKARHVAAHTGLPLASVAGAYAALSPQNDWNMNVYQGDVVIDAMLHRQKTPWSDKMTEVANKIGRSGRTKLMIAQVRGKRLEELTHPVEQAMWIRIWNEASSDRYHRLFRPDGKLGDWARKNDGGKQPATWKTLGAIANAIKATTSGGDREIISEAMGGGNKVRSFYNNILDPESANGDITVDTHAIGAGLFDALGGSTAPVLHGLGMTPEKDKHPAGWKAAPSPAGTGVSGLYGIHAEAYRRAARDLGLRPLELQSLTWEAKRALFEHMPKNAKPKITAIWKSYHDGHGSLEDARRAVIEAAGGWKEPDWTREARD